MRFFQPPSENTAELISGTQSLRFDPKSVTLRELFFDQFEIRSSLETDFLDFLEGCDIQKTIELGHKVLRTSAFDDVYNLILGDLNKLYGVKAHQVRPTFRIQKTGTRSVPFHTDDMSSGHPSDIINVWMPLTSLNNQNTLHFVDKAHTADIKQEFISQKESISWLTSRCLPAARPWIASYGDAILFTNKTLHGTQLNTLAPRASIDFRILPSNASANMNNKKLYKDFLPYNANSQFNCSTYDSSRSRPLAVSVVYTNGDALHLSHQLQRSIINEFALDNSFYISEETVEWQVPHHPVIEEILDSRPDVSILLSTEKSYTNNGVISSEFKALLPKIEKHPQPVWFCLENKRLN